MSPGARAREALEAVKEKLEKGEGVTVIRRGSEKILRIEWLNLYNDPEMLRAIAECVLEDARSLGIGFDAVASIETSGAKYGVTLALLSGKPYFSIHKVGKLVFLDPAEEKSFSVTESSATKLYVDKPVASKFPRVLLVDDIRRSSTTINVAVKLLSKAGSRVEACYVVLDLAFAGHPPPRNIVYRPLFVVSSVGEDGRLEVSGPLC